VNFDPKRSLFVFSEKEKENTIKKLEEWRFKSIIERLQPKVKKVLKKENEQQEKLF
jgi:transcriptional regulator of NAD metabolism